MTYNAIVAKLSNVREHSNADRLKLATVAGNQVVIGLDTAEDTLGIFFACDGQLSEQFATANDLIARVDPETHEKKGGYFSANNRRVRAQKLRGERSDGFWIELDSLVRAGVSHQTVMALKEGDMFCELDNIAICNKYFTAATIRAMQGNKQQARQVETFAKHQDTSKFRELGYLPINGIVYFTEKLHGTSGRFGYVPVTENVAARRGFKDRLLRRRPTATVTNFRYVIGTRNTVLGENTTGYYGSEEFRSNAVASLQGNLHKGEILYFELVGYTTEGSPLMHEADTTKLKDKQITKLYGNKMRYKYGCGPKECKLYVYRITTVNEDNNVVEYSWPQVKARCQALGIESVPEILTPRVILSKLKQELETTVNDLAEGPSILDTEHIREGIVLRIESADGTQFVKHKSFLFSVLEGFVKEQEDLVDLEEAS